MRARELISILDSQLREREEEDGTARRRRQRAIYSFRAGAHFANFHREMADADANHVEQPDEEEEEALPEIPAVAIDPINLPSQQ